MFEQAKKTVVATTPPASPTAKTRTKRKGGAKAYQRALNDAVSESLTNGNVDEKVLTDCRLPNCLCYIKYKVFELI